MRTRATRRPARRFPLQLVLGSWACVCLAATAPTAAAEAYIEPEEAARLGLEVGWRTQAVVDAYQRRMVDWRLAGDRLYATSSSGTVTAIDAVTGAELWVSNNGRANLVTSGVGTNGDVVAMVNGSRLYVLDAGDGHVRWQRDLDGIPIGAPAVTDKQVFVALVTGLVEGYDLAAPRATPWFYQSSGSIYADAQLLGGVVAWPNDLGAVYVADAEQARVKFRLATDGEVRAAPSGRDNYLYIASTDHNVYCMEEDRRRLVWDYATGYPIEERPAVINDRVYVASREPRLHALRAKDANPVWTAEGVSRFAAVGGEFVYGLTNESQLVALTKDGGVPVAGLPLDREQTCLPNDKTDRLYVVNEDGYVQCLHPAGASTPTYYAEQPVAADEEAVQPFVDEPADRPQDEPLDQPDENPFRADQVPADEPDDAGAEENPFGTFDPFE
ncbi:MAG: PQQ-binding-like beta-propeller repeat protein [Planctomycetota bacterium]